MSFLHIYPQIGPNIRPVIEQFTYYGRTGHASCKLVLSPEGNYTLFVYSSTVSEGAVKRDPVYKNAIILVTQKMVKSFEEATEKYIGMHKDAPRVVDDRNRIEDAINNIKPKRYERKRCNLPKPKKDEVEKDLSLEAKSLIHNDCPEVKNAQYYISKNLNKLFSERESMWQEAVNLFNNIEDAREKKANNEYQAEAERNIETLKNQLVGNSSTVMPLIDSTLKGLQVPFELDVSYDYNKNEHSIDVQLVLVNQLNVFCNKAAINLVNKITIKQKLVREITTEKTQSALSLIYSVAYRLFTVSANVDTINISLWKNTSEGYIWISFDRKSLLRNGPQWTDLLEDYSKHLNVSKIKQKADSIEIPSIPKDVFEGLIKLSKSTNNKQLCKISIFDAQLLLIQNFQQEIRDAIDIAQILDRNYVYIDIKYKNMLKEI